MAKQTGRMLCGFPESEAVLHALQKGASPLQVTGISPVNKAHIIYCAYQAMQEPLLLLTPDEPSARRMVDDINSFSGAMSAWLYPARELIFSGVDVASHEYEHARLAATGRLISGEARIIVAAADAALQYTAPPAILHGARRKLATGGLHPLEEITKALLDAGYRRFDQVEGVGQFSVRGGIVDFFPPGAADPCRIELWGDEIDSISSFKADTQRRIQPLDSVWITLACEIAPCVLPGLHERLGAILLQMKEHGGGDRRVLERLEQDCEALREGILPSGADRYLPLMYQAPTTLLDFFRDGILFLSEPVSIKETLRGIQAQLREDILAWLEAGELIPGCEKVTEDFAALTAFASRSRTMVLDTFERSLPELPFAKSMEMHTAQLSPWSGELSLLVPELEEYMRQGYCCCVFAGTERAARAVASDLATRGMNAVHTPSVSRLVPGKIYVLEGSLSAGFEQRDAKLAVISHIRSAVRSKKTRAKQKAGKALGNIAELAPGDYVVHASHGIGVFEGIIKREIHGVVKDYIKIRYAGTDTLFVPVTQLDLVTKYIGARDDANVRLNKLNSAEWQKTRSRVRSVVSDIAKELIRLYSERMKAQGHAFSEDTDWQRDFELRFPYDETDDQLRCIDEIKADMQAPVPMDRLLCGDVGFGKTEVALRAVFKCVMDGKQCAVLVPTTILAWQHYQTFLQRMEGYPITVELLSRFVPAAKQREIVKRLAQGKVDVVIGTHRLVQNDIRFKDLGLCVIDEEQRFGVSHKEKMKELFKSVDALSLSATPIPRTLNMALSGLRGISIIDEAPQDRYPVQTYVVEHDMTLIATAIRRELRVGGQVFYLHNRIESIDACARRVQDAVPEARVVTAHGKMGEEELSSVWRQLIEKEIDVLVCTTIIETGVDVPNCNTLIIEDADRMGLSQLYQLRGRVGRSNRRAFAYLTFTRGKAISEVASKRLSAIREFTSFGSGFRIAMRDLEIRGAGNILGAQQHGHMEAVGYEMYLKMLSEAVSAQMDGTVHEETQECLIDIRVDAHIPEEYIQNSAQRIDIYRKIASIADEEDAMDVTDELIDRFGEPPKSVLRLVDVALLRNTAAHLGINEIAQKEETILFYPKRLDMKAAGFAAAQLRGRVLVNAGAKPYIALKLRHAEPPVDSMKLLLAAMAKGAAQEMDSLQ